MQAAVWIEPGGHTLHAWHAPAVRKVAVAHAVHALGPAPEQVEQVGSHVAHLVSAVVVHATAWYVPGPHVSHRGQPVPLRYLPATHVPHAFAPIPVQLAHDGSHEAHWVSAVDVHAAVS